MKCRRGPRLVGALGLQNRRIAFCRPCARGVPPHGAHQATGTGRFSLFGQGISDRAWGIPLAALRSRAQESENVVTFSPSASIYG